MSSMSRIPGLNVPPTVSSRGEAGGEFGASHLREFYASAALLMKPYDKLGYAVQVYSCAAYEAVSFSL